MEIKGKISNVQTNSKVSTNNQNVNSMNINQGSELSKQSNHSDSSSSFTNTINSSHSISPSSSNNNLSSNNVHLENHLDSQSTQFKLEHFSESTTIASSPYVNEISSPCLSQPNSSVCLATMNSDLSSSFNNSAFNSNQQIGDLENNPHLLNRPTNLSELCTNGLNLNLNTNLNSSLDTNLDTNLNSSLNTNHSTNGLNSMNTSSLSTNSMNSNDAIAINNLPNNSNSVNFNCSPHQVDFFNQPDTEQMNSFDTTTTFGSNQQRNKQPTTNNFPATTAKETNFKETCATCSAQIMDRYLLKVNGHSYHEKCLLCCCCGLTLNNVCYQKNSKLYCKQDYLRLFFRKCDACNDVILPTELVMKIYTYTDMEVVFHLKCFACHSCKLPLKTGDHFSFHNGLLVCRQHLQTDHHPMELGPPNNKLDQLVLTSSTSAINSPLTNLCHTSSTNLANPLNSPLNNSLNSNQSSLHLQPRSTLCNLSNSLQNNLPNQPDNLQLNPNLNNLMLCSSNSIPHDRSPNHIKLNNELVKEQNNKEPMVRNRPRTILTTAQRRAFRNSFEISQKPCRKVREGLAKETGLSVRIVQVWFQNQRASRKKERRRLEGKMLQQSSNLNSQTDLSLYNQNNRHELKNMQHHNAHQQTSTSYSNEESRSQITDESDEDYEHFQFVNSPNDTGSYYSQSSYSKSINGDLEEENLNEEENCLNSIMRSNKKCNKKSINCNNSNSFEFSSNNNSNNVFPAQSNVNFTNSDMSNSTPPLGLAVAQAITSTDVLTTNGSAALSKSNSSALQNSISNSNGSDHNALEFSQTASSNSSMTPIDKLYSMQSSYFSTTSENCENCLTTN